MQLRGARGMHGAVSSLVERRAIRVLRVAGGLVLALSLALQVVFPTEPVHRNPPGFATPVLAFELASDPRTVVDLIGEPGSAAHAAIVARIVRGHRLDFFYALAYPAIYVGVALLLAARGLLGSGAGGLLIGLALAMTVGDWLENRELLALCAAADPSAMVEPLARLRIFTLVKWYALFAASGLVAVGAWADPTWWRWSALFFGGAALLGLGSVVHLPAIEYATLPLAVAWGLTWVHALRS